MVKVHKPTLTPPVPETGLVTRGLSVTLGAQTVLRAVDFHLAPGEIVGLIGPNGAGKSTLLRAMLGLVETDTGSVSLNGSALDDLPLKARARRIAYAPQGAPVHWPLTVQHLVELGRLPHLDALQGMDEAGYAAVDAALAATDTSHLRDRIATTLSGGERAGVMLARAIAVGADYLFADEPVAALDPYHQIQVMDILAELAAGGTGVAVVLHDLALASRYCQRVTLLDHGAVVADGPPAAVLDDETLARVYRVRSMTGPPNTSPGIHAAGFARVDSIPRSSAP